MTMQNWTDVDAEMGRWKAISELKTYFRENSRKFASDQLHSRIYELNKR